MPEAHYVHMSSGHAAMTQPTRHRTPDQIEGASKNVICALPFVCCVVIEVVSWSSLYTLFFVFFSYLSFLPYFYFFPLFYLVFVIRRQGFWSVCCGMYLYLVCVVILYFSLVLIYFFNLCSFLASAFPFSSTFPSVMSVRFPKCMLRYRSDI